MKKRVLVTALVIVLILIGVKTLVVYAFDPELKAANDRFYFTYVARSDCYTFGESGVDGWTCPEVEKEWEKEVDELLVSFRKALKGEGIAR
ncbi:hypothetical protein GCM10007416_05100 [Kroppenstedtia guangzhouensis]|uniref:Uncharacterized protein n=1 Tax=Kroppenstedtia guangzhouensis TaxID=1274356 RepID=A0ABQ1G2S9_9BACL|nr:hypothetical protein [Kroppenstedtia guangzhouensis]GGA35237.1 hypothetical protein GCM10007416_05100 [Kroppenstedtia guangzhouensis]